MQIIYEFNLTVSEYAALEEDNIFPCLEQCPICKAQIPLRAHGFYQRNAVIGFKAYHIKIRRYKCLDCKKTISILPSFLLPYYQYSLEVILERLKKYFQDKKDNIPFYRQLTEFYAKRFLSNLPALISFFRDVGQNITLTGENKEKAIKLLEMISVFPKTSFSRRYQNQFLKGFMAL